MNESLRGRPRQRENVLFARLSNPRLWGRDLFVFSLILSAFLTLIMDVLRLDSITWLWFIPLLISFGLAALLGVLVSLLVRRLSGRPYLWVANIAFGAALGAVKNVMVGVTADALKLTNDATWVYRVFAGAIMGSAMLVSIAMVIGARSAHREAVRKLMSLQQGLVQRKKLLEARVNQENAALVESTNAILIPKLRQIEQFLTKNHDLSVTVNALRATIEKELRPLTRRVQALPLQEMPETVAEREVTPRKVSFPKRLQVRAVLRPVSSYVFNAVSFGSLMFFFGGYTGTLLAFASVAVESLLLLLVKNALPSRTVDRRSGVWQLVFIAVFCSIPNGVMVWYLLPDVSVAVVLMLVLVASVGSAFITGYSVILDNERSRVEQDLERENETLTHELAVYDQRIWVFRKSWQLMLHGTVQAALTAALTRLSVPTQDEGLRTALVRQDIARAEVALQASPVRELDLHRSIAELSTTWRGVCDVSVKVSERAARALKRNFEVMFGVNEIMREAVSNAVRHGGATQVEIEIDRESDEVIDFVSKNNGKPVRSDFSKGVGSQMLDELTLEWKLTQDERRGKTLLTASIPVLL
jgi:signal transduction histidine kinase